MRVSNTVVHKIPVGVAVGVGVGLPVETVSSVEAPVEDGTEVGVVVDDDPVDDGIEVGVGGPKELSAATSTHANTSYVSNRYRNRLR